MNQEQLAFISDAKHIIVVQAENPDGDSLGSSLALEEILSDMGKTVTLYAHVDTPKYLRYIPGWDRITSEFDTHADLAIIVDTTSETLLSQTLDQPHLRHYFETHPVIVLDHHGEVESTLPFSHELINDGTAVSTGELIFRLASENNWAVSKQAAEALVMSIMSDSLGLTTEGTTAESVRTVAALIDKGASLTDIEQRRRELMKKSPEILAYKGALINRIEYYLDGALALVHIPWEDIQEYSDQYNPSVLVLDEMRLVHDVQVAIAIKTYPDGKVTGKIRANMPIADTISGYFGGGGHRYASGFRVYESYDTVVKELLTATEKAIQEHANIS